MTGRLSQLGAKATEGNLPARPRRPSWPVAHTPRPGTDDWDRLDRHLAEVAEAASDFAGAFSAANLGTFVGVLHDVGKFNIAVQQYLFDCHVAAREGRKRPSRRVPHSVWGAALGYLFQQKNSGDALRQPLLGAELGLSVLGHHAGLPTAEKALAELHALCKNELANLQRLQQALASVTTARGISLAPVALPPGIDATGRELFVRMLFSALVDADHLATELHFHFDRAARRGPWPRIADLCERFDATPPKPAPQSATLKRVRDDVFAACLAAAAKPPGLFCLAVPTGGGKTRSALGFALHHARAHGLRRVVVALPYTSITEQVAAEYRSLLGPDAVLEHHSAVEIGSPGSEDTDTDSLTLAAENWEGTAIVTTTVQLFESLFANRPSRCRKLHRLARSVIILDEVQTLPPELLLPTLDVIRSLVTPVEQDGFGATVVLSTATQPAFELGPFANLLRTVPPRQLVEDFAPLYAALRRVDFVWRPQPATWEEIADELRRHDQVMAIVNTRKDALALLDALGDDPDAFHLSSLLCGAHRRQVLAEANQRLRQGRPVRLICTQVVECGVDLDFPVVYRALGPLDRIVQAAGRCNRNGNLGRGLVVIFKPAVGSSPGGAYRDGLEQARLILEACGPECLHDPQTYASYFGALLRNTDQTRGRDIQTSRAVLDYPTVAESYRMIEDTVPVVVPYGPDWKTRLEAWRAQPSRESWRRLQPVLVNLYQRDLARHEGWLESIGENLYFCPPEGYDAVRHRGLIGDYASPIDGD